MLIKAFSFTVAASLVVICELMIQMSTADLNVVQCSSGEELAAALADADCHMAILKTSITLEEQDWTRFANPVYLGRNFTIAGARANVTLDMNFVRPKVVLGNGTTLAFRTLVLENMRSGSFNQAPGIDLLHPMPRNESATILLEDLSFSYRACFPLAIARQAAEAIPRAPQVPGSQVYALPAPVPELFPQEGCINSVSAPPLSRCYAYAGLYIDVAITGADPLPSGRPEPNGYLLRFINVYGLCCSVLPDDCIARLGPLGCVLYTYSMSPPPPGSRTALPPSSAAGIDGSPFPGVQPMAGARTSRNVAIGVGSVLGGLLFATCSVVIIRTLMCEPKQHRASAPLEQSQAIAAAASMGQASQTKQSFRGSAAGPPALDAVSKSLAPMVSVAPASAPPCGSASKGQLTQDKATSRAQTNDVMDQPRAEHQYNQQQQERATSQQDSAQLSATIVRPERAVSCMAGMVTRLTPPREDLCLDARVVIAAAPAPGHNVADFALGSIPFAPAALAVLPAAGAAAPPQRPQLDGGDASPQQAAAPKVGPDVSGTGGGACAAGAVDSDAVLLLPTLLGKGASGRVFEGVYRGTSVAVKVLAGRAFDVWPPPQVPAPLPLPPPPQQQLLPEPLQLLPAPRQVSVPQREPAAAMMRPVHKQAHPLNTPSRQLALSGQVELGDGSSGDAFPSDEIHAGAAPEGPQERGTVEAGQVAGAALPGPSLGPAAPGAAAGSDDRTGRSSYELRVFRQEVEVLGRCDHPHVVRLLAACLTPPRVCLVMERCETSLDALIYGRTGAGDGGPQLLPLPTVLHIAIQICQGLEYLHPTIVHRDLKPANVLINGADSAEPVVKLSDFGLSRIRCATLPTLNPEVGTPAFMAPECYDPKNNVITHRADIYSLGVLIWSMLTGQRPWKGHIVVAVAYKVALLGLRPPLEHLTDCRCPPRLKDLIRQCWDADPLRRPAAAEAAKVLYLTKETSTKAATAPLFPRVLSTGGNGEGAGQARLLSTLAHGAAPRGEGAHGAGALREGAGGGYGDHGIQPHAAPLRSVWGAPSRRLLPAPGEGAQVATQSGGSHPSLELSMTSTIC